MTNRTYPWSFMTQGMSWSWSYGNFSWIYNYLCSQCLSPLTLWGRFSLKRCVLDTEKIHGVWKFNTITPYHPSHAVNDLCALPFMAVDCCLHRRLRMKLLGLAVDGRVRMLRSLARRRQKMHGVWKFNRVDHLLWCGKHLHHRIISVRGGVWAHKTSFTPQLFIEVPASSQESERSYIFVLWISILPLSMIFL